MSTITKRVTHNTAVRRDGSPQLYAVDRYHKNKDWGGGWKQTAPSSLGWYVGYNFFIDEDGTLTQTRRVGEETIAQTGHNCDILERCDAMSVCLAFSGAVEVFNEKQSKTYRSLMAGEIEILTYPDQDDFDITECEDVMHRDLQSGRTCPGSLITYEYLDGVRNPAEVVGEDIANAQKIIKLQSKIIDLLMAFVAKLLASK